MKNIPLHFQILIALIAGTILGFLFNPGEISLDNLSLTVSRSATGYQVTQKAGEQDQEAYQFKNRNQLLESYPELKALFNKGELEKPVTVEVTGRLIHIVDSANQVKLSYTRNVDQKVTVSSYAAPQW